MSYFEQDYLEFFKELAPNNNKDWFDSNRKRFVSDLIAELAAEDPELDLDAKDAIFRINKDIRFSKDKTPYKLNNSAIISPEGRKNKNHPGIYIELGPERLAFYGGIYMPSADEIQRVRSYILANLDDLKQRLEAPDFRDTFGRIEGEKSKRIPKEFVQAAERQPLLWNKQWYYYVHLSPEVILSDELMATILDLRRKSLPMKQFLSHAILD